MKYAIIIMDGAADEPLEKLGGQTVLEAAKIPHIDRISQAGQLGMVHTVPEGFHPGSDVALMSVMGYAPQTYYNGRAPLEAAAQNIVTGPNEWIFRCNLVTVSDGVLLDYSAGHIDNVQAAALIKMLQDELSDDDITFYSGVSYRHLMVHRSGPFEFPTTAPHDMMDEPLSKWLPRGKNAKAICKLMEAAAKILADHDVNQVRRDLGESPATDIWLWGQGQKPQMDNFTKRYGLRAAVITAVDLMRGLGKLMGMQIEEVEGATGYLDTNYKGKGQAAIELLKDNDLVFVHIESPDEAGHGGLTEEKIDAIEAIDTHIVGPVYESLVQQGDPWRMMVLPDHPTPIRLRTHVRAPIPFALAGSNISPVQNLTYSEANGRETGLEIKKGHELMEYFLKG